MKVKQRVQQQNFTSAAADGRGKGERCGMGSVVSEGKSEKVAVLDAC